MLLEHVISVYLVLAEILLVCDSSCMSAGGQKLLRHLDDFLGGLWSNNSCDTRPSFIDDLRHKFRRTFNVQCHVDLLRFFVFKTFFAISVRVAVEEDLNLWRIFTLRSLLGRL